MVDLQVATLTGSDTALREEVVQGLKESLRGDLFFEGEAGYDGARTLWNGMIDKRPALIARCAGVSDVINSVNFARVNNLLLAIKGGGHNVAGNAVCDGGLMIDLSLMKGIRVDPNSRTVRAETGVLLGEFDRETQVFGLATTAGFVSTTGLAGLTLGGGQGWLASKHGFTIDNLLSADVVTADGNFLTTSATQHEDLFWALRGAGHNFGVVTSFEYRLHPVGPVLGGMVIHPFERARDVLRFHRDFTAGLPDEVTTAAGVLTAPDGNLVAVLVACYSGPLDEGERVLAPLRQFGPPTADMIGPIPYTVMQTMSDEAFPPGRLNYWKSGLTDRISDEVIDAIVDYGGRMPSPFSAILIPDFHGAYMRVGKTETAYYHRDLQYDVLILANWTDPADSERNVDWARELFQVIEPHLAGGVYVNGLGEEGEERARAAYGENYERLVALKNKYDPTNLFRLNQNIKPTV